ncbi:hypothetical protein IW492_08930 [Enterococcus sp. BWB1-3]|nr:hypothetical protein [Enterococcus sp. BWB1-3]
MKEKLGESLPLYKLALQILLAQIAVVLIKRLSPQIYKQYFILFQWCGIAIALYALVQMIIFTCKLYTKDWRELDDLLQEYEGDTSKFDFSFPNEFIRGIYHAEGLKGGNTDFIKKLDKGVEGLDSNQRRIALIQIKNYNSHSFNFFSGYYILGILTIFATMIPVFNFETLKSSIPFFALVTIYAIFVGGYIYRINKKKIYICKIVEDILSYSINQ